MQKVVMFALLLGLLWGDSQVSYANEPQPIQVERSSRKGLAEAETANRGLHWLLQWMEGRNGEVRQACDPNMAIEEAVWQDGEDRVLLPALSPNPNAPTYDVAWYRNICIASFDGTAIAGNVFIPQTADPNQTFPVIIFTNSWALNEYEYTIPARQFAEDGYVVFSYSARGWGNSGGLITAAGPNEVQDISIIIDWIELHTPANGTELGMAGISYGAGLALLGAAHDSRVTAVVAMSGWSDLVAALYGQQTPRDAWGNILVTTGNLIGDMDPIVEENFENLLNHTNVPETIAWANERSAINYLGQINVPVYISQNMSDELFQPNALMQFYTQLDSAKKLDINQGIHATAELPGLGGLSNYSWDNAHDWFDYWLQGVNNGVMDEPPVTITMKNEDTRLSFNSWPSPAIANRTYYLSPRDGSAGDLDDSPSFSSDTDNIETAGLIPSGATTGIPVISALLDAHTPFNVLAWVPLINQDLATVYESDSLDDELMIVGIPVVDVWVSSTLPQMQLVAYLYDVNNLGVGTLITHGPVTLYEAVPGQPTRVTFEMVATAYRVADGHHLVLAMDMEDSLYGTPTDADYEVTFYYDESSAPLLLIPYLE